MHSVITSVMRNVCPRQLSLLVRSASTASGARFMSTITLDNQQLEVAVESNKVKLHSLLKTLPAKIDSKTNNRLIKWLNDGDHDCRYVYAKKDGNLAGFALLHKDEDMQLVTGQNASPAYLLDLVYSIPQFRRAGLGAQLLTNARLAHQHVTTFVEDEGHMEALFKAGYKQAVVSNVPQGTAVFMYP